MKPLNELLNGYSATELCLYLDMPLNISRVFLCPFPWQYVQNIQKCKYTQDTLKSDIGQYQKHMS